MILPFVVLVLPIIVLAAKNRLESSASGRGLSHSYPRDYDFNGADGWQPVAISDLPYKYSTEIPDHPKTDAGPRSPSNPERREVHANATELISVSQQIAHGMKGTGQAEEVIITWYTGNDLKNPSCWAKPTWAPSDESFACAVTLEGWVSRPGCFKFLELCNGTSKCIFVRVVDTCAGCKKGSKHVDLTKAAFSQLAKLEVGVLENIQMRLATEPSEWNEALWGPLGR